MQPRCSHLFSAPCQLMMRYLLLCWCRYVQDVKLKVKDMLRAESASACKISNSTAQACLVHQALLAVPCSKRTFILRPSSGALHPAAARARKCSGEEALDSEGETMRCTTRHGVTASKCCRHQDFLRLGTRVYSHKELYGNYCHLFCKARAQPWDTRPQLKFQHPQEQALHDHV